MKYEKKVLQDPAELQEFIKMMREEKVRSYLEIGSKFGGSLWRIGTQLPNRSRIVSVDLPHGDKSPKPSESHLQGCVRHLKNMGYDAHLFIGDSTDPAIVAQVARLAPFDVCFIDANHTEPYVRSDWANYGPMARIVAFHDISWIQGSHPPSKKFPIEVAQVWNEIKQDYRHREIRLCRTGEDNGFGILWRS